MAVCVTETVSVWSAVTVAESVRVLMSVLKVVIVMVVVVVVDGAATVVVAPVTPTHEQALE